MQLLQLQHARARSPALRTTRTLDALRAAVEHGLLEPAQAEALATAWRQATRVRNAIMLVRDKAEDQLPSQGTRAGRGRPGAGLPGRLRPGRSRSTTTGARARRARKVVEEVFYARLD